MNEELPKPDYARNMRLLGYSDQGGRPDGVQIMVARGHALTIGRLFLASHGWTSREGSASVPPKRIG